MWIFKRKNISEQKDDAILRMNRYVNHDILDQDNFEVKRWNGTGYDCNGKETYKLEDGKGIVENYHESFNGSCFLNFKVV